MKSLITILFILLNNIYTIPFEIKGKVLDTLYCPIIEESVVSKSKYYLLLETYSNQKIIIEVKNNGNVTKEDALLLIVIGMEVKIIVDKIINPNSYICYANNIFILPKSHDKKTTNR